MHKKGSGVVGGSLYSSKTITSVMKFAAFMLHIMAPKKKMDTALDVDMLDMANAMWWGM